VLHTDESELAVGAVASQQPEWWRKLKPTTHRQSQRVISYATIEV